MHALRDVDFSVAPGEWVAITGPSGAGKSTLLNIIGCLDRPTSGRYLFNGIDTGQLADSRRAGLRSREIGFVFQAFHLLPYRTVLENVMLAAVYQRRPAPGRREGARLALAQVGLAHRVDYLPANLSGGEKQRVAIARALLASPRLLLCDEPTGNLDSKATEGLLELLHRLNRQGLTIVIVTHDASVAARAGRRVHLVDGVLEELSDDNSGQHLYPPMRQATSKPALSKERERAATAVVPESGISFRDLLDEVLAGLFSRPGRLALTILGIVIGLTAVVATLGISTTAGNRIISQFDELAATEIVVTGRSSVVGVDPRAIPWDAPARLQRLNGVVAAGTLSELDTGDVLVSTSPIRDPAIQTAFNLSVQAASPELFAAVRAEIGNGRVHDLGHSARADRVAVLGRNAAGRLGIQNVSAQFLLESAVMGVIGGTIGASLGVIIVVVVSAYQVWTPVLDPVAPLLSPFAGGLIGVFSGTYPAFRAARLEPVAALRR